MNDKFEILQNVFWSNDPFFGDIYYLSIRRQDDSDIITWSELQEIKNALYGNESQALEVYPKESNLVNYANVRHIWIISSNFKIPFSTNHF